MPTPTTQSGQAIGPDAAYRLILSAEFQPDIDLVVSEGIAAFGMKGSGKSNALARILEQIRRYPIPFLVPDTKGEHTGLGQIPGPARFIVATASNCPTGQEILTQRLQVVMDLRTWETDEGAALAMAQILNEMFAYASSHPENAIPCPCFLDEAQYWLPQQPVPYLEKETARQLRSAWHVLATRARSLGLVPNYFTQNISELHKSVMRQCGMYILMRQFLDSDLDRYTEFVKSTSPANLKKMIRGFPAGKAIVILPSGQQIKTQFYPQESVHPSHTPTVRALMTTAPTGNAASQPTKTRTRKTAPASQEQTTQATQPRKRKAATATTSIVTQLAAREQERQRVFTEIHKLLDHNADLSPMELAWKANCELELAKEARTAYFTFNLAKQTV